MQFKLTSSNARISYGAQGEEWHATLADLQKTPCMSDVSHWLAVYVMLSRATDISGLLISRFCTRKDLQAGAPTHEQRELTPRHLQPVLRRLLREHIAYR